MPAADGALLGGRLLLAGVFAVAAVGKLADRDGTERALVEFGGKATAARVGAVLLPLAELVVAVALVPAALARWGAAGALVLLSLFTVGVGATLARGQRPDCHCFGQLHSRPVGWTTVVRNLVLGGLAGVTLAVSAPSIPLVGRELADLSAGTLAGLAAVTVLAVLCTIQTGLLLNVIAQNGRLLLRLDAVEGSLRTHGLLIRDEPGLAVGDLAPTFSLKSVTGEPVTLESLTRPGRRVLLVFSDPECEACEGLLPDVARWQRHLTVAVISRGDPEANAAKAQQHGLRHVLLQRDLEVSQAFDSLATPSAVIVDAAGRIASSTATGADAIRALVTPSRRLIPVVAAPAESSGHQAPPRPLPVGRRAPKLSLPDLNGRPVEIADFVGTTTVVLFWHPACGFCQEMLPALRRWEAESPPDAPRLLVVSSGTIEENRALRLAAPVVLDENGFAPGIFGAGGTPMAVAIDAEGRVATPVVAGAGPVLELLVGSDNGSLPQTVLAHR